MVSSKVNDLSSQYRLEILPLDLLRRFRLDGPLFEFSLDFIHLFLEGANHGRC